MIATRRAAGAQQQHAGAAQRAAQVEREIAHQSRTVGVVAEHGGGRAAGQAPCERIDGPGALRARRERRGQLQGQLLVRHGDIQPASATAEELARGRGKAGARHVDQSVVHRLLRGAGEQRVDLRRFAVADVLADHRVAVNAAHARPT